MSKFLQNAQNNLICAVDVETTGTNWKKHDIIQVAVIPANGLLQPSKLISPFIMELLPRREHNIDQQAMHVNKKRLADIKRMGTEYGKSADLFFEWFEKLRLPLNKRIMPIASNWPFDREFIIDWLGPATFDLCFDARYRDTMVAATFRNDRAGWKDEDFPYPTVNLSGLVRQLGIETDLQHDAVADAVAALEVYRQQVLEYM